MRDLQYNPSLVSFHHLQIVQLLLDFDPHEIDKANLLGLILNAKNQFNDVQLKLREKYGDVDINAIDGTIKKKDEQADKKDQYR